MTTEIGLQMLTRSFFFKMLLKLKWLALDYVRSVISGITRFHHMIAVRNEKILKY